MSDKRLGGMKLGNFSGIKKSKGESIKPTESEVIEPEVKQQIETQTEPVKTAKSEAKVVRKRREPAYHKGIISPSGARQRACPHVRSTRQTKTKQKKEQLVTVNIKIRKDQKEWLTDTASTVRDNNTEPVPPSQRVYPQHLIGVAIDLLEAAGVDWGEVRNVEELREHLNL